MAIITAAPRQHPTIIHVVFFLSFVQTFWRERSGRDDPVVTVVVVEAGTSEEVEVKRDRVPWEMGWSVWSFSALTFTDGSTGAWKSFGACGGACVGWDGGWGGWGSDVDDFPWLDDDGPPLVSSTFKVMLMFSLPDWYGPDLDVLDERTGRDLGGIYSRGWLFL